MSETTPRGVAGIARTGAIMLGLGITGLGYLVGSVRQRTPRLAHIGA